VSRASAAVAAGERGQQRERAHRWWLASTPARPATEPARAAEPATEPARPPEARTKRARGASQACARPGRRHGLRDLGARRRNEQARGASWHARGARRAQPRRRRSLCGGAPFANGEPWARVAARTSNREELSRPARDDRRARPARRHERADGEHDRRGGETSARPIADPTT
jgi:hypothetical protein